MPEYVRHELISTTSGPAAPKNISRTKSGSENRWCNFRMVPDLQEGATTLCVTVLSPYLFNVVAEMVMREALEKV